MGLFLYQVDLVEWSMGVAVAGVEPFPCHWGVPPNALAEFIHKHASRFAVKRQRGALRDPSEQEEEPKANRPVALWL